MKYVFLASAVLAGFISQAQALTITTTQVLPPVGQIIVPTPEPGFVGFSFSTSSVVSGGTITALSPFTGVAGYTSAPFDYVLGNGTATFTKALDPTFVTGGDTFSFIYGSPDSFNTISFSNGMSFTGADSAFSTKGSGYFVTTVSGLGSYDSVTFASSTNSVEFATYNVSSVPLPASLPMFGGALLALGGLALLKKRSGNGAAAA
ncbi:hypothetical protein [Lichenifustis flavocetrariae]|uniref:VPLPA-CTERM sorting domain-containing protein n=1 Tax=Lichenifustis flavocetrariae TaxID=2949735 RepID=A0AA41YQP7_9HYPH|nr:hypothetical protein [Lichenifustis flavocetrariae]MCW6506786.1 hypothetical protein [Lichenifustis flavocetrariae]